MVPRPLTLKETSVLVVLITRGASLIAGEVITGQDRARWLEKVPGTRAGRSCGCGTCPSIGLTHVDSTQPDVEDSHMVLEVGTPGAMVLLHIDSGDRLVELELAPMDTETFSEFPDPKGFQYYT